MTDGWVGTRGGREEFQGKLQIADQMMGGDDDSSVNWQRERAMWEHREDLVHFKFILNK